MHVCNHVFIARSVRSCLWKGGGLLHTNLLWLPYHLYVAATAASSGRPLLLRVYINRRANCTYTTTTTGCVLGWEGDGRTTKCKTRDGVCIGREGFVRRAGRGKKKERGLEGRKWCANGEREKSTGGIAGESEIYMCHNKSIHFHTTHADSSKGDNTKIHNAHGGRKQQTRSRKGKEKDKRGKRNPIFVFCFCSIILLPFCCLSFVVLDTTLYPINECAPFPTQERGSGKTPLLLQLLSRFIHHRPTTYRFFVHVFWLVSFFFLVRPPSFLASFLLHTSPTPPHHTHTITVGGPIKSEPCTLPPPLLPLPLLLLDKT